MTEEDPKLAEFGQSRFASRVAYLATVRKNRSPRVNPVTPIIAYRDLYVFMGHTSPKGFDLKRNGLLAMHASVENEDGGQGEFYIAGRAYLVEDKLVRSSTVKHAGCDVDENYVLFRFSIDEALGAVYKGDETIRHRWKRR